MNYTNKEIDKLKKEYEKYLKNTPYDSLSFKEWLIKTFEVSFINRACLIKSNYINLLESELNSLKNESLKYKSICINESPVIRKKLLKVNPMINYNLDLNLNSLDVSEVSEDNEIFD